MKTVTAKSYTLKTESGSWLGQVMLSSDGAFTSITDYGNFCFAWRSYGDNDFREFLISINGDYFSGKMYNGINFLVSGKKIEVRCKLFADKILPALQKVLKEELEYENALPANSTEPSTEFFNRRDIELLRGEVYRITGKGEVMQLFNKLLGVNAA